MHKTSFNIILFFLVISFSNCQPKITSTIKSTNQHEIHLSNLVRVARVTGKSLNDEKLPNPNDTKKYDVGGTDLGIIWEINNHKTGLFFGDTFGRDFIPFKNNGGGNGSNWRSNVLAFSEDENLDDGLTISDWAVDQRGKAREILAGAKANTKDYQTSIPTSAIHANGADYVHYMNIYEWTAPKGRWLTNYSSVYASYDEGRTWQRKLNLTFDKNSKFSQVSYAKKDGYVYMLGKLSGRGGPGWLGRFKEKDVEKIKEYEYWNGTANKWAKNNEAAATPVISAPLGEASLMYHEKFKRWIIMYIYDYTHDENPVVDNYAIVYRDAKELNGNWSDIKVLITGAEYPGLYSPYMHPLKNKGNELYFTMSLWGPYNVFLMKADIKMSTFKNETL